MGLDSFTNLFDWDSDKTFWERNVSPAIVESDFAEEHPLISGAGDYVGGGISNLFSEHIPNFISEYNKPDSDSPIIPIAKWGGNFASEAARIGADTVMAAGMAIPEIPDALYNLNAGAANLLTDWTGIDALHTDYKDTEGWGGFSTAIQDAGADLGVWGLEDSGMRDDAQRLLQSYSGYEEITPTEDNPYGISFKENLEDWAPYQSYIRGSGQNLNKIRDEAAKLTEKDMTKWSQGEGSTENMNKYFKEHHWDPMSREDKAFYDYNTSFAGFYNSNVDAARNYLNNKNEFSITGEGYGDWASKKYRDELISKYGRYPVEDFWGSEAHGLGNMKLNISPFLDEAPSNFNLANQDYVDAIAEGRTSSGIGAPKEFDYGFFDKESGVGISKWGWDSPLNWSYDEPFKYKTEAAKNLAHSGPVNAAEWIFGMKTAAKFMQNPQLQKFLHGTKSGRVLREALPGLTHHNPGLFKMKKDFGLPKFDKRLSDSWYKKLGKGTVNVGTTAIDWMRPKGGQFGAIIAGSERDNRR
tara:strand:+ start:181 stop:1758 length:1578 start_codon:yes stop_codon:yes gene_type:complete